MAKKKKKFQETTIENYYDLRVDKVDELVSALKDDTTPFDEEVNFSINASMGINDPKNVKRSGKDKEFDPYKTDFLGRVPVWVKALFAKFWFAGMICYFVMWGIGLNDTLDSMVVTGAVLGIIVDILVNPLFRYMETDKREFNAYMMFPFPFRAFWTFFTNIIYYVLVLWCVMEVYGVINLICSQITGVSNYIHFGVEPLMFGVITVIVDMVFIGIKDGIVALVRHQKNKRKESVANV